MAAAPATFPWLHFTALGSPLVPEVKTSMNSSAGSGDGMVTGASRWALSSSAHAGASTSVYSTSPRLSAKAASPRTT